MKVWEIAISEDLGENVRQRGLADPALAVQDDVLTALTDGVYDVEDLVEPTCEERDALNGCAGREDFVYGSEPHVLAGCFFGAQTSPLLPN
jgi:hypothetical protein